VEPQEKPFVSVATIRHMTNQALPKGDFRSVLYRGPSRAIQVLLYVPGTYYLANVNPYTGEIIHLQDMNQGWLNKMKHLHRNLLMGAIGRKIVHWCTLLYLIIVISGIILWWPSNSTLLKKRLGINFRDSFNVFNYRIHNTTGFYVSWVLIFVIITGLFFSFSGIKNSFRKLSGEDLIKYDTPLSSENTTGKSMDPIQFIDKLAIRFRKEFPNNNIRISNPHKKDDPIQVSIIEKDQLNPIVDHLYFDRYTLERLNGNFKFGLHQERSFFSRLQLIAYDIHFGSVMGFTGRFLVFIASLLGATLPISGFLIWWKKIKLL
jgi:uncharacterized iron-regulated membrane protein